MVMKSGERWHCVNPACGCVVVVESTGRRIILRPSFATLISCDSRSLRWLTGILPRIEPCAAGSPITLRVCVLPSP